MRYIKPYAVFDGHALLPGAVLVLENGHVTQVSNNASEAAADAVETFDGYIGPGLVDCQVNGGGGVMLNNRPTPEGVRSMALAHRAAGVAYLVPTVITDSANIIERAADAVLAEHGSNGVVGLHIEGPHINVERKGTHRAELIRPFDDATLHLLENLSKSDLPVLVTLAPECVPAGIIRALSDLGVIVSAGHSMASPDVILRAIDEGLRGFTHLFNGMPAMTSRQPGIVGTAINSHLWCGIIADGHHVDDQMVKLAIRARPESNRMVLVSDAMSTIGGPDHFELYGESIRVREGRLVNAGGSLAGAHVDLLDSVKRLIDELHVDPETALRMATTNPREFLRLPRQVLVGSLATELSWTALKAPSGNDKAIGP